MATLKEAELTPHVSENTKADPGDKTFAYSTRYTSDVVSGPTTELIGVTAAAVRSKAEPVTLHSAVQDSCTRTLAPITSFWLTSTDSAEAEDVDIITTGFARKVGAAVGVPGTPVGMAVGGCVGW